MEVREIHPNFAGEISGVDLSRPLDGATIAAIDAAINKHGVVVFHDQTLNNDTQAAFGRQFGELEVSSNVYRSDNKHRIESRAIVDVSNLNISSTALANRSGSAANNCTAPGSRRI